MPPAQAQSTSPPWRPARAGVWYDLSKARAQLGELEGARTALKRACELDEGFEALGFG